MWSSSARAMGSICARSLDLKFQSPEHQYVAKWTAIGQSTSCRLKVRTSMHCIKLLEWTNSDYSLPPTPAANVEPSVTSVLAVWTFSATVWSVGCASTGTGRQTNVHRIQTNILQGETRDNAGLGMGRWSGRHAPATPILQ